MISKIADLPEADKIVAGYQPDNKEAHHLYASLGLVDNGGHFGKEKAVTKY